MINLKTKIILIISILGLNACTSVPNIELPQLANKLPDFNSLMNFESQSETAENLYNKKPGFLSAKFESGNNNPGIIGKTKNKKGQYVYAYGTHQLCKENIQKFIYFLRRDSQYKEYYNALINAGGYQAALKGSKEFKTAWQKIAKENQKKFIQAQDEFMYQDYLRPRFVELHNKIPKLELDNIHPIVLECIISTMIQHRDYIIIIKESINNEYPNINSEEFIKRLYQVRKNHAGKSIMIAQRYAQESKLAISYLPLDTPSSRYLKVRAKIFTSNRA